MKRQHPLSKHESLLSSSQPVMNFNKRDGERLQQLLDRSTARTHRSVEHCHTEHLAELDSINGNIERTFQGLIANVPGLTVIHPEDYHDPDPACEVKRPTPSNSAAPVLLFHTLGAAKHKGQRNASPNPPRQSADSSGAAGPSRDHCPSQKLWTPGGTLGRTVDHGTSIYTYGFPSAFESSGFNSVLHWAKVSFEEARMTAFGAGADLNQLRKEEPPPRLLITVACYLLNEVLTRDPALSEVWRMLSTPILDAVFSPSLIATENARWDARSRKRHAQKPGDRIKLNIPAEEEDGLAQPYPLRCATYETVHDYANFRLWSEEVASGRRDNQILSERVAALKSVVGKSRLVLQMAQRRVSVSRMQSLFYVWRAYTARMRDFRDTISTFMTHSRQRQREEVVFLKWRRLTVQAKVEKLQEEFLHFRHQTHLENRRTIMEINDLKQKLKEEQNAKQCLLLKDDALRAQIIESCQLESNVLHVALTKAHEHNQLYKKHARRWQRLAITFRPAQLCPPPPKALVSLSIGLRADEDQLATCSFTTGQPLVPQIRGSMEKFLLHWVNYVMKNSPDCQLWVPVTSVEVGQPSPRGHTDSLDHHTEDTNANVFGLVALHCLLRELRRLQQCSSRSTPVRRGSTNGVNGRCAQESPKRRGPVRRGSAVSRRDSFSTRSVDSSFSFTHSSASLDTRVLETLCSVLYGYTAEGLHPSLLMHCPNAADMLAPGKLLIHPTAMLWVLAALFTGYVRHHMSSEAFMPPGWPTYLQCRAEPSLQKQPSRTLAPGMEPIRLTTTGSYLMSPNTVVGKRPPSSPRPTSRSRRRSVTTLIDDRRGLGGDVDSIGVGDTVSDVEVYIGLRDDPLPPEHWQEDVDHLLATVARMEECDNFKKQLQSFVEKGLITEDDAIRKRRAEEMNDHSSDHSVFTGDDSSVSSMVEEDVELDDELIWAEEHLTQKPTDSRPFATALSEKRNSPPTSGKSDPSMRTLSAKEIAARLDQLPAASWAFMDRTAGHNCRSTVRGSQVKRCSHRRKTLHHFVVASVADRERRQTWLGLARVITSLITRFHVLHVCVSSPDENRIPGNRRLVRTKKETHTNSVLGTFSARVRSSLSMSQREGRPRRQRGGEPGAVHSPNSADWIPGSAVGQSHTSLSSEQRSPLSAALVHSWRKPRSSGDGVPMAPSHHRPPGLMTVQLQATGRPSAGTGETLKSGVVACKIDCEVSPSIPSCSKQPPSDSSPGASADAIAEVKYLALPPPSVVLGDTSASASASVHQMDAPTMAMPNSYPSVPGRGTSDDGDDTHLPYLPRSAHSVDVRLEGCQAMPVGAGPLPTRNGTAQPNHRGSDQQSLAIPRLDDPRSSQFSNNALEVQPDSPQPLYQEVLGPLGPLIVRPSNPLDWSGRQSSKNHLPFEMKDRSSFWRREN